MADACGYRWASWIVDLTGAALSAFDRAYDGSAMDATAGLMTEGGRRGGGHDGDGGGRGCGGGQLVMRSDDCFATSMRVRATRAT